MKTVDHSYEQALIMHDYVHIHVIMNIIMTPTAHRDDDVALNLNPHSLLGEQMTSLWR